ncbi:uncharacterized protein N7473_013247 [Penicillium subrubescens]|uniref:uncharacterized protein n=1 Tax=Penicillium subrubescens TaxID=1316194 RepID=UPI0025458A73|nr:uncharacterized protein N7473_013151 [Penicillium subrubescens]XP_057002236.1 uncharacterized protein N7473_013247 [Penicillium subrubescens]KAJ5873592.1 hypothetical protein N7473_013151 [Penicillium subrubescens]KAJ5873688.1 hypothetical protein N7473_013247 [Penicillium subrubescens]
MLDVLQQSRFKSFHTEAEVIEFAAAWFPSAEMAHRFVKPDATAISLRRRYVLKKGLVLKGLRTMAPA